MKKNLNWNIIMWLSSEKSSSGCFIMVILVSKFCECAIQLSWDCSYWDKYEPVTEDYVTDYVTVGLRSWRFDEANFILYIAFQHVHILSASQNDSLWVIVCMSSLASYIKVPLLFKRP